MVLSPEIKNFLHGSDNSNDNSNDSSNSSVDADSCDNLINGLNIEIIERNIKEAALIESLCVMKKIQLSGSESLQGSGSLQ